MAILRMDKSLLANANDDAHVDADGLRSLEKPTKPSRESTKNRHSARRVKFDI